MLKNKEQAVIFDFDGVLANTFNLNLDLMKEFIKISSDELKGFHEGNIHQRSRLKLTPEIKEKFFNLQREKFTKDKFYPIAQSVEKLARKFLLFINSSSTEQNVHFFLKMVEIEKYFSRILGLETDKSKVKKFQLIFKHYAIEPKDCVFVTDTLGDLMEGNRVGVKNLAVSWGYHKHERLKRGNPLKIIDQVEDLVPAINELLLI